MHCIVRRRTEHTGQLEKLGNSLHGVTSSHLHVPTRYATLRFMSRADEAILEATRELLIEQGVHRLTMEGVATRAGVAKTTLYRRYRSKHELALAVLVDMVEQVVVVQDAGDTRTELIA